MFFGQVEFGHFLCVNVSIIAPVQSPKIVESLLVRLFSPIRAVV